MNARFVAGLAVAAIPIMSLLGAASASADITSGVRRRFATAPPMVGKYNNTVGKYNDPPPSVTTVHVDPHSVVRLADMAVRKQFPLFAAPFDPREFAAIGQSWGNSFCHDADSGSQNGASITITDRDRPRRQPQRSNRGLPVLVSNRLFPLCWGR